METNAQSTTTPSLDQIKTNLMFAIALVRSMPEQSVLLGTHPDEVVTEPLVAKLCSSPFFNGQGLRRAGDTGLPYLAAPGAGGSAGILDPEKAINFVFGDRAIPAIFSPRGAGEFDEEIGTYSPPAPTDQDLVILRLQKSLAVLQSQN